MRREILKLVQRHMSRVTKGERLLEAMKRDQRCELTEDGANYIRQRFDPYHDNPVKPVGYPDQYNGHTISRIIKKSVNFTATSGGGDAPTTPWSFQIVATPILNPLVNQPVASLSFDYFNWDQNAVQSPFKYGGLMIVKGTAGAIDAWQWGSNNTLAQEDLLGQLALTADDLENAMRVTAMGFEFIDSTAQLYRQGLLTAYRQNQPQLETFHIHGDVGANPIANRILDVDFNAVYLKFPPQNTAAAMLMPDTKQWKVEEGAYVDIDFNSDKIPLAEPEFKVICLAEASQDVALLPTGSEYTQICGFDPQNGANFLNKYTIPTTTPQIVSAVKHQANKILPINQSGLICTGVSPQFAGTVNVIYYVECAPGPEDTELLTLAYQCPIYCPLAMEIISKLRHDSPIAVKLKENYLGEWFFNGIRDIAKSAMPWLSNAQTIGNQVIKWVDTASTNDGYINPQTLVKGDVAKKIAREKQGKVNAGSKIPKAPGPAPKKVAFAKPKVVKLKNRQTGRRVAFGPEDFMLVRKTSKMTSPNQKRVLSGIEKKNRKLDKQVRKELYLQGEQRRLRKAAKRAKKYPNPSWNTGSN
jgi:hypothetical protein